MTPRPDSERLNRDGPEVEGVVEAEHVSLEPAPATTAADLGIDLPDDHEQATQELLRLIAEARDEATSYLDDLKRVAADFDNFRRRALREHAEAGQRATERLLVELVPVLDTFDAADTVEATTGTEEKLLAGLHRTHEQLLSVLRSQGVEVVPAEGEPFDPQFHEAVMSPSEGEGTLVVSQELRRGYTVNGRLVRPALVALEYKT